jgi:solute carrier family 25 iron transporter 28/37
MMDLGSCEEDLEWEEWNPSKISFVNHMIAGSFAGVVEHVSIFPVDTIKTHIQYERSASFQPLTSFRALMRGEGGFFRLWRGVSAMFAGCIPGNCTSKRENSPRIALGN